MNGRDVSELEGTWLVAPDADKQLGDTPVLVLDEALSFWGGFDAETGTIIDRTHPQHGKSLANKIVVMPGSRGSSGTPGVLGEAIRRGTGPTAMVVTKADINLVAGSLTAAALYGASCPILLIDQEQFEQISQA